MSDRRECPIRVDSGKLCNSESLGRLITNPLLENWEWKDYEITNSEQVLQVSVPNFEESKLYSVINPYASHSYIYKLINISPAKYPLCYLELCLL